MMALVLEADEQVEQVLVGRYLGQQAALALTSKRVLIVNEALWRPEVVSLATDDQLSVQGWHDNRTASLSFQCGGGPAGRGRHRRACAG